jgi:UDP-N-acetylglucosamine diphosphorylase / glucose-1-phosphate thymidylyltransferase / UDP-N-acetylgalactosamine diphosphorylase / glucosamine-1-phosphate N-acetyltransferase / galactosamine-1-phosphate N-acetyltransferase
MTDSLKIVVLCGGIGKRMLPITADKSLLPFNGMPLIFHQINRAKKCGVNRFLIVTNPGNDTGLRQVVSSIKDISVDFVVQKNPKGMADALRTAAPKIGYDPFILFSADDVFDASLFSLMAKQYKSDPAFAVYLAARKVDRYFPGGYLATNNKKEVTGIVEKPRQGEEPSNLVNIVLHLHTMPKILFQYLRKNSSTADDVYEQSLAAMIKDGYKMKAMVYKGEWKSIKYPWHILELMDYFGANLKRSVSPKARIASSAVIDGDVVIEDNVRILEGAVIRGPSYIGANSVIGNGVLVRESFINKNCVVGYGSEVKHSYISDNCWFHTNYIGDSVIDIDCSFGAGAVTANFRTDEREVKVSIGDQEVDSGHTKLGTFMGKGSRVGVNASIMPGIKIGANCVIGPHVFLNRDIDPNIIVVEDRSYKIIPNRIRRQKK